MPQGIALGLRTSAWMAIAFTLYTDKSGGGMYLVSVDGRTVGLVSRLIHKREYPWNQPWRAYIEGMDALPETFATRREAAEYLVKVSTERGG